jgi:hypothetical protein
MVRKLLRGERSGGVLTVMGTLAVICLLIASIALRQSYMSQAKDFKQTLYERCQARQVYDRANHDSIGADVALYRSILKQNEQVPESAIPPEFRALARQQRATIQKALAEKEKAFKAGVPGNCEQLK